MTKEVDMDIGMLWFDNDNQTGLEIKVKRAVSYYQEKYGKKPNLCFVNPCMIATNGNGHPASQKSSEVEIRESNAMLPNHFWIGIKRQETGAAAA
jgi:hypothetical protein